MKQTIAGALAVAKSLMNRGQLAQAAEVIRRAVSAPLADFPRTRRSSEPREETVAPRPARTRESRDGGQEGRFIAGSARAGAQGRYKLYVPSRPANDKAPLVVMLHGCTQGPDDFAAGTEMNRRAEERGFYVLYPEQSSTANPSRCWNWFNSSDQQRGKGEPGLIASLTREVIATYGIDPKRVHVAGLSAGGAMAAIVAAEYPELFASVGVHSGLPPGAASNVPDALTVMRTGRSRPRNGAPATSTNGEQTSKPEPFVPIIVFHGDRDGTVHPLNGQHVIDDALQMHGGYDAKLDDVSRGTSAGGQSFTRTTFRAASGQPLAEHWVVHGAAHAWSGGNPKGSHTDGRGPSATDEMLRFFLENPQAHAG